MFPSSGALSTKLDYSTLIMCAGLLLWSVFCRQCTSLVGFEGLAPLDMMTYSYRKSLTCKPDSCWTHLYFLTTLQRALAGLFFAFAAFAVSSRMNVVPLCVSRSTYTRTSRLGSLSVATHTGTMVDVRVSLTFWNTLLDIALSDVLDVLFCIRSCLYLSLSRAPSVLLKTFHLLGNFHEDKLDDPFHTYHRYSCFHNPWSDGLVSNSQNTTSSPEETLHTQWSFYTEIYNTSEDHDILSQSRHNLQQEICHPKWLPVSLLLEFLSLRPWSSHFHLVLDYGGMLQVTGNLGFMCYKFYKLAEISKSVTLLFLFYDLSIPSWDQPVWKFSEHLLIFIAVTETIKTLDQRQSGLTAAKEVWKTLEDLCCSWSLSWARHQACLWKPEQ